MKNMLDLLAMESGLIPEDTVTPSESHDMTVGDLIAETHTSESPVTMLDHAEKAREIADDLDELAERADQLADQDERYSTLSVESLGQQFALLMKTHRLGFKAHSFESELSTQGRRAGISADARRTAIDLRANAHALDTLSTEGIILDLFKDKDRQLKQARVTLQRELGAIKGVTATLNQQGVVITHDGVAAFLTKRDDEVHDFKGAIAEDVAYLAGVEKYVTERIQYLSHLPEDAVAAEVGDEHLVNTADKGVMTGLLSYRAKAEEYALMGNYGVFGFKRIEKQFLRKEFTSKDYMASTKASLPAAAGIVAAGVGTAIVVGALTGSVVAAAAGYFATAAIGTLDQASVGRNAMKNVSEVSTHITMSDLSTVVNQVLSLEKYADTDAYYKQLEQLELRKVKGAKDEVAKVKKALAILKTHAAYMTLETARLLEHVVKKAK